MTGQGLPELQDGARGAGRGPACADPGAPVRLWVDRVFSMTGSGTVVTGTLPAGTVRTGDELLLAPARRPVRIRGIESLNQKATQASGVARVAVNLRGTAPRQLAQGMALVEPGGWTLTGTIDVKLADLPGRRESHRAMALTQLPRQVTVHIGSARTAARVRPFGGQLARLSLASRSRCTWQTGCCCATQVRRGPRPGPGSRPTPRLGRPSSRRPCSTSAPRAPPGEEPPRRFAAS